MQRIIILILTLMLAGRSMTLAFISRAGGTMAGDPPAAWLMPLIGDAIIGIGALFVAFLFMKKKGLWVWTTLIIWNVVGIWDALSAFLIHLTVPWPAFFMTQIFGSSMFFMASLMHLIIIFLLSQTKMKSEILGRVSPLYT